MLPDIDKRISTLTKVKHWKIIKKNKNMFTKKMQIPLFQDNFHLKNIVLRLLYVQVEPASHQVKVQITKALEDAQDL
jgi:hypothetical protein